MWFEILENGQPVKRFKHILSKLSYGYGMMDVPETEITLPIDYLQWLGNRKQVRIHLGKRRFLGFVDGIDTDTTEGTIKVKIAHIAREWRFRQVPTNHAVKKLTMDRVYEDGKMSYSSAWTLDFDEAAKKQVIDYVYSRQNKLDALTKTCELTQDIWWRIGANDDRKLEIGKFGQKKPYMLTVHPKTNNKIQIIEEPTINEDYSNVINMATVYGMKSDSGASSMSLREVYEDKKLQNPNFPVVIISSDINNEREYDYESFKALAPNTDLEYSVIDTESVANESGLFIEETFSFEDMSPFSLKEEDQYKSPGSLGDTGKWAIPQNQRYLTQAEKEQNMKAFAGAMLALGATLQCIAAIGANIDRESGWNPNLFQGLNANANPINQEGFGLVQWTPYTNITNWMAAKGYTDYRTYGNAQVEKLHEEMQTGQQWIDVGYGMSFSQFWTSKADPSYLAIVFERNYERGLYDHAATTGPKAIEVYNWLKEHESELGKPGNAGTYDDEHKEKIVKLSKQYSRTNGIWDPQHFIDVYNGKSVDQDGVAGYQCVDTFKLALAILGDPDANRALGGDGYAHQIWYQFDSLGYGAYFEKVPSPQLGDFAIFSASGETPASHVAMYVSDAGGGRANFFGQNQGASYHNTVDLPTSNVLGYLRVKPEFWENGGGNTGEEQDYTPAEGGNGTAAISDEDRLLAAKTVYEATIKKLINARRIFEVHVKVGDIPDDLNVGDMVQLGYNLDVTKLENCSKHQKKVLTMDRWWYVTAMQCTVDPDGTTTWELTLDKYLRLEREVQKQE